MRLLYRMRVDYFMTLYEALRLYTIEQHIVGLVMK
jgi:hypothetical protein